MKTIDNFEGWRYINAIFALFEQKAKERMKNSHIAPMYIYRGISKRFFTESNSINRLINSIKNAANSYESKEDLFINGNSLLNYINNDSKRIIFSKEDKKENESVNNLSSKWVYECVYENINSLSRKGKLNGYLNNKTNKPNEEIGEIGLLKAIEGHSGYFYIKPEQIRSGASVRLRDTGKTYTTIADYLSYTRNLITDFKTNNPAYSNYDDLEVLAEIQHKGGGSCLVDFSRNFLISLWFAVNGHLEDMGYLFCYDVNSDAFIKDNLTHLNNVSRKYDIEKLLRNTRKITSYLVEDKHRFWLWKPSNINGRIARQDSVFVFGIEKFIASEHNVEIIPIPATWKMPILKSLKDFFWITADSVFPDVDGFSNSHSKNTPLNENTFYINPLIGCGNYFDLGLIQKGMYCLLNGNYRIALDYFLKSRNQSIYLNNRLHYLNNNGNITELHKVKLEVIYSIGLCYSKLNEPYYSIDYFEECITLCFEILFGVSIDSEFNIINENKNDLLKTMKNVISDNSNPFLNKFYRIIDDYIDTLYDIKDYSRAAEFVNLLLNITTEINRRTILQLVLNCLTVLHFLHKGKLDKNSCNINLLKIEAPNSSFCSVINGCNIVVAEFVRCYKANMSLQNIITKKNVCDKIDSLYKMIKNYSSINTHDTSLNWVFEDIEEEIATYFKDSNEIVNYLKRIIVKVRELQYSIQCNKVV